MRERWYILFVLFFARMAMAFQYQSVAALSPFIESEFAVSLTDIGILIGLYLGPGIIVAIPGGALATRFGDKRVVAWSLVAMLAGGLLAAWAETWWLMLLGRILAGAGGVVINVVMTKMLIDWFAGHEIGTAMGIFISSWPLGIALALLALPPLAADGGLVLGWSGVVVVIAVALALFIRIYRPAPGSPVVAAEVNIEAFPVVTLLLAAFVWALFNTALAMVFGFGPLLLTTEGLDATSASAIVGVFTLMVGIGVPVGGFLSDRFGIYPVIAFSLGVSAALLPVLIGLGQGPVYWIYAATGLIMGLAAGPIMTMPSLVLPPRSRAFGMGVFFTTYYAVMMLGPAVGGRIADASGGPGAAYLTGSIMLIVSLVMLLAFQRLGQRALIR